MKFSRSLRIFGILAFLLFRCYTESDAGVPNHGEDTQIIPLRQLLANHPDESALENLFVFDPNGDLAENLPEVEMFLELGFQSHPSLVLSAGNYTVSGNNPKKLIMSFGDAGALASLGTVVRTVKFLEITLSNRAEIQQLLTSDDITENLPNLRFIFLRIPMGVRPEELESLMDSSVLVDYHVFFSIDSSN